MTFLSCCCSVNIETQLSHSNFTHALRKNMWIFSRFNSKRAFKKVHKTFVCSWKLNKYGGSLIARYLAMRDCCCTWQNWKETLKQHAWDVLRAIRCTHAEYFIGIWKLFSVCHREYFTCAKNSFASNLTLERAILKRISLAFMTGR